MKKRMKVGIAVLLCLAFLLGSAVTQLVIGLYPANVTTVWVNNPPLHEADYIIGVYNSTHYYAKNGTTGFIEFCGTNASQIIQQTINSLPNGRTWKEKIILKGEFTIDSTITLPSYTILEVRGKIKLANNAEKTMILVSGSHTEIIGGTFDGNNGAQTSDLVYIIKVDGVVDFILTRAYFHNSQDDAVVVFSSKDVKIYGNSFVNCGDSEPTGADAIDLNNVTNATISNNYILNPYDDGIDLEGTNGAVISNNHITNGGIEINDCTQVTVADNTVSNSKMYGIWIGTQTKIATVSANYIFNSTYDGIVITNHSNATVVANQLLNNQRHGIAISNSANGTIIEGNICIDNDSNGINISNSDGCVIIGNRVSGSVYGVAETGTSDYTLLDGNNLRHNTYAHSVDASNSIVGENIT